MSESKYAGDGTEKRPEFNESHPVWCMLKRQRDNAKAVWVESDMLMQAIEAAPELDKAMQVTFGLGRNPANMTAPPPK